MERAVWAIVTCMLVAGCVAAETEPEAPATNPPECTSCAPKCPPDEFCADPLPLERRTPLSYQGRTPGYACVRAVQCTSLQAGEFVGPPFGGGSPVHLVGNLTWSAQSEATETFIVQIIVDMGNGWEWDPTREPEARGPSPLLVDWDLRSYPEGTQFSVYVETGTGIEAGWVSPSQDYAFDGVFVGR